MTTHDVKIEPRWFDRIQQNEKFAEVRYDDRDYQTGDTVQFWRTDADHEYRFGIPRIITHVLRACDGVQDGYVVLSLADPRITNLQSRLDSSIERERTLERSNRALRGTITRLNGQLKAGK